jgi:polysaccharide deacetylase 2 family uncharacterized protein YibQ
MAPNDLDQPLRRRTPAPDDRALRPLVVTGVISAAVVVALAAGVWIAMVDDPSGGQPVAIAAIENVSPESTGSLEAAEEPIPATGATHGDASGESSVETAALASVPAPLALAPDALIERSDFGPLPKIAEDGTRAMDAYRRPAQVGPHDGMPRIVIVVGGMGISQTGTQDAIEALPEDVTLAFAPYGGSLQRWVDRARQEGHEVLLQVPLEPANYPETDPGEHTLLVSAESSVNEQNLMWLLGRMTAYTGVMNYLGAGFSRDEMAFGQFLSTLSERGLFYLDDGSSAESLAEGLGAELGAPVAVADAVVDLDRSPARIYQELRRLESLARSKGLAIGVASAFPGSVTAIADWASQADSRGFALVPASAALER